MTREKILEKAQRIIEYKKYAKECAKAEICPICGDDTKLIVFGDDDDESGLIKVCSKDRSHELD